MNSRRCEARVLPRYRFGEARPVPAWKTRQCRNASTMESPDGRSLCAAHAAVDLRRRPELYPDLIRAIEREADRDKSGDADADGIACAAATAHRALSGVRASGDTSKEQTSDD